MILLRPIARHESRAGRATWTAAGQMFTGRGPQLYHNRSPLAQPAQEGLA